MIPGLALRATGRGLCARCLCVPLSSTITTSTGRASSTQQPARVQASEAAGTTGAKAARTAGQGGMPRSSSELQETENEAGSGEPVLEGESAGGTLTGLESKEVRDTLIGLERKVPDMDAITCTTWVKRLTVMANRDVSMLERNPHFISLLVRLSSLLHEQPHRFGPCDITSILYAVQPLPPQTRSPVVSAVHQVCLARGTLADFHPKDLSRLIHGFHINGSPVDEAFLDLYVAALGDGSRQSPQELAMTVFSLAKYRTNRASELAEELVRRCVDCGFDAFEPQDLSHAINAVARVWHYPGRPFLDGIVDACTFTNFSRFPNKVLGMTLLGFSKFNHDPGEDFLRAYVNKCMSIGLPNLDHQTLGITVSGLARFHYYPGHDFMSHLVQICESQDLTHLPPQALCNVVTGVLGFTSELSKMYPNLLPMVLGACLRGQALQGFAPRDLCVILNQLTAIKIATNRLPKGDEVIAFITSLCQVCLENNFHGWHTNHLYVLITSVATLQYRVSDDFVHACLEAFRAKGLDKLKIHQMTMVINALAKLKYNDPAWTSDVEHMLFTRWQELTLTDMSSVIRSMAMMNILLSVSRQPNWDVVMTRLTNLLGTATIVMPSSSSSFQTPPSPPSSPRQRVNARIEIHHLFTLRQALLSTNDRAPFQRALQCVEDACQRVVVAPGSDQVAAATLIRLGVDKRAKAKDTKIRNHLTKTLEHMGFRVGAVSYDPLVLPTDVLILHPLEDYSAAADSSSSSGSSSSSSSTDHGGSNARRRAMPAPLGVELCGGSSYFLNMPTVRTGIQAYHHRLLQVAVRRGTLSGFITVPHYKMWRKDKQGQDLRSYLLKLLVEANVDLQKFRVPSSSSDHTRSGDGGDTSNARRRR